MKTEFDALRLNDDNGYEADKNGNKQTVKLYRGEQLIAKKISINQKGKKPRYFGVKNFRDFI